jgi:hypothetical protein
MAEQAKWYDEMVEYMEKLVTGSTPVAELNLEERNLLSMAHRGASCHRGVQRGASCLRLSKKTHRQTCSKNARREEEEIIFEREREWKKNNIILMRNTRASPCVLLQWHRCNFFD